MKLHPSNPFRHTLRGGCAAVVIAINFNPASAATVYWDTDGATAGSGGSAPAGNWEDANWSTSDTGEDVTSTWTAGDTAVFAAGADATDAYVVTLAGANAIGGMNVEEGSPTLSGSGSLVLDAGATSLNVASGAGVIVSTAISGGTNGLVKNGNGALTISGGAAFSGDFVINGGDVTINSTVGNIDNIRFQWNYTTNQNLNIQTGADITTNRFVMADLYYSESTVSHSGGTLNIVGTNDTNSTGTSFLIGHWGYGSTCVYGLSGGTLNSLSTRLSLGWDRSGVQFNQSGGTANLLGINLNNSRGNTASYNLTGGRLNIGSGGINNQANKSFNAGGATIGAFANWNSTKEIKLTGDLTVDTLDSADGVTDRSIGFTGGVSEDVVAGIIKEGDGILALSGAISYTGDTIVNGGVLLPGSELTSSNFVVNADGSLGAGTISTPGTSLINDVTLNGGNLRFRAGAAFDRIDALSVNITSPSTIEVVPSEPLAVDDEFPVLKYFSLDGLGFAGLSPAPLPNPHYSSTLIDDTVNSEVILKITGADSLIWTGAASGDWDVDTSLNWKLVSALPGTTASKFYDADVVIFDDTSSVGAITLSGSIKPASITVNNSVTDYSFSGSPIAGGGSLLKQGTASLDLSGSHLFSGSVSIEGGRVVTSTATSLGTGTSVVPLGTDAVLQATASYTHSRGLLLTGGAAEIDTDSGATLTLSSAFSGGGALTKSGDGTLRVQGYGNNSFGGTSVVVTAGTYEMAGGAFNTSIGLPSITVDAGAQLVIPPGAYHALGGAYTTSPTLNLDGGTFSIGQEQYLDYINMTGASIQSNGGNPEIRSDYNFNLHTFASTDTSVVGSGMIFRQVNKALTFTIDDGDAATDFLFSGSVVNLSSPIVKLGDGTMVVDSNLDHTTGTTISAGTLQIGSGGTSGALGTGAITNDATLSVNRSDNFEISSVVSGTGSLVQAGTGFTILSGANTYSGSTVVNDGAIAVDGDSLPDVSALRINGAGQVDVLGVESVQDLYLDGLQQAIGTYGSSASGATFIDDTHFTGTGVVNVTGPGYASWIAGFGLAAGDQDPGDDPDNDGLSNAVEWVLGGNPATGMDVGKLPVVSTTGGNLVFTFIRDQDSKTPGTSVAIEVGTSLVAWPTVFNVGNDTPGSTPGVTVTDNGNGTDTITLTVAQGLDLAKFARLRVIID